MSSSDQQLHLIRFFSLFNAKTGYGRLDTAKSLENSLWSLNKRWSPKLWNVSESEQSWSIFSWSRSRVGVKNFRLCTTSAIFPFENAFGRHCVFILYLAFWCCLFFLGLIWPFLLRTTQQSFFPLLRASVLLCNVMVGAWLSASLHNLHCSFVTSTDTWPVNRVAILANFLPDSGKLNFESFGYKCFGLAIWWISGNFLKAFGSKFFGFTNCTTCMFARICLHFHSYADLLFLKLADGLKIPDIKWKCKNFESRNIVLNTYQMCLQNVETD